MKIANPQYIFLFIYSFYVLTHTISPQSSPIIFFVRFLSFRTWSFRVFHTKYRKQAKQMFSRLVRHIISIETNLFVSGNYCIAPTDSKVPKNATKSYQTLIWPH